MDLIFNLCRYVCIFNDVALNRNLCGRFIFFFFFKTDLYLRILDWFFGRYKLCAMKLLIAAVAHNVMCQLYPSVIIHICVYIFGEIPSLRRLYDSQNNIMFRRPCVDMTVRRTELSKPIKSTKANTKKNRLLV